MTTNHNASSSSQSPLMFVAFTATAAATAALAIGASVALTLPAWAVFVGWVAFYTRGPSARDGAANLACVLIGIGFGMAAALAIGSIAPFAGSLALPIVVFGAAMVVVSLRAIPPLNNLLCYFLGMIAFFAAHLEPSLAAAGELGGASALGSFAGWVSHISQRRLLQTAK
jgi:hypothetical protein